jgi:hypothetical protein
MKYSSGYTYMGERMDISSSIHISDFIGPGIALALAVIGGAVLWGKLSTKVDALGKMIEDFKKEDIAKLERRIGLMQLELDRGVTEDECTRRGESCRSNLCGKIDGLITSSIGNGDKIDKIQNFMNLELRTIATFMGEVTQYMKEHKKV